VTTLNIEIAGISTRLVLEEGFCRKVESAARLFKSEKCAEYTLRVNIVEDIPQDKTYSEELFVQDNRLMINSNEYSGYMDLTKMQGQVDVLPTWALAAFVNFLKNLYSALILFAEGLMLHAAAVVRDDTAYIFFAPSGGGKSTVAGLSSNYTVLTDELVAVRRANGSFDAYGTPFWGSNRHEPRGINSSFRIGGLFKLVKDSEVYLKRFPESLAAAEILTVPQCYYDLESVAKLLNSCSDLARVVPCHELHFLPDSSFWRCIDGHISQMAQKI
jgi:hypothetical protein